MQQDIETKKYFDSVHRMGSVALVVTALVMIAMPVIAGLYFDAMPTLMEIIQATVGLWAIFVPIAISEIFAYTPVLGSSFYLSSITGNISNLKLPVANQVLRLLDVQAGTEDADIVTSIAVGVSSLVTIIILVLGVILMLPLEGVLKLPQVKLAASNILPALFGCMGLTLIGPSLGGGVTAKGRMKGMVLPAVIILFLNIFFVYIIKMPVIISSYTGFLMLLMLPVAYFSTKALYKRGSIKVFLPGETDSSTKEA